MPDFKETRQKIKSFGVLPVGWHYGEGVAPSIRHLAYALSLLKSARSLGFERFNAFPGIEGEVQVTIYEGPHFFQFTIEPNGEWTVVHEINREEVRRQEHLGFTEVIKKLDFLASDLAIFASDKNERARSV